MVHNIGRNMILERMWDYTNNQKAPKMEMVWEKNEIIGLKSLQKTLIV